MCQALTVPLLHVPIAGVLVGTSRSVGRSCLRKNEGVPSDGSSEQGDAAHRVLGHPDVNENKVC